MKVIVFLEAGKIVWVIGPFHSDSDVQRWLDTDGWHLTPGGEWYAREDRSWIGSVQPVHAIHMTTP